MRRLEGWRGDGRERLKQQPSGRHLGKSAGQGSTAWEAARGEGAGPGDRLREETGHPAAVRQGDRRKVRSSRRERRAGGGQGAGGVLLEKGPEGCGAGCPPQGRGRGTTHPGGQEPAKEGLLGFFFFPTLSFQLLSIIHSQGAALTAINKAFILQREAEIISSRLPALPGQWALALRSPVAYGPTQDMPGKGRTGARGGSSTPPQRGAV